MKTDTHQHVWTEPLLDALANRSELPFARQEQGLTVLYGAGERPYVIDLDGETPAHRAELVQRDGLDRALVCLSSPIGIEALPREHARPLIDAYLDGALALGEPFGVWAPLALAEVDPGEVERALERGCVGISLPAGALGSVDALARIAPALARLQSLGAPLFVHPGPGTDAVAGCAALSDPLWWPALTRYIAEMQAAWLVWVSAGQRLFGRLRVAFAMLAGLAPLHAERLHARGGPVPRRGDPQLFYETSSYGPHAIELMSRAVGANQLVHGSDRPVIDPPEERGAHGAIGWELISANTERLLAPRRDATPTPAPLGRADPARRARSGVRARRVAVLGKATR